MSVQIGQYPHNEDGADVVAAIKDLLTDILVRLPAKSLLRFKSVSKHWLSLISSRRFCVIMSKRCCKHISGLLLRYHSTDKPKFHFIPLELSQTAPFGSLGGLDVIQHCNGLLLCSKILRFCREKEYQKYCVFNPTTRQHTTLIVNRVLEFGEFSRPRTVNLAFDPRISPHYKLVCSYRTTMPPDLEYKFHYMFRVYSSETGLMTRVNNANILTALGIYWNGAINWINCNNMDGTYFNVDEECVGTFPMPPEPEGAEYGRKISYYGKSNDHLYLIHTNLEPRKPFDVYEMDREYSGWVFRFRVHLQPVFRSCGILGIVDNDDEKPFLVLSTPGKAIQFHLNDASFTEICDFPTMNDRHRSLPMYHWLNSIQFVESLHPL